MGRIQACAGKTRLVFQFEIKTRYNALAHISEFVMGIARFILRRYSN